MSLDIARKLQQPYAFVTMDLAAAKIAYDIVWSSGDRFKDVVIHLGPFHTICSYMGSLGKMMTNSGFEDAVIEANICASGSINQVLSGKQYNRAFRVHEIMLSALERLLVREFFRRVGHCEEDYNEIEMLIANAANVIQVESNRECQQVNSIRTSTNKSV